MKNNRIPHFCLLANLALSIKAVATHLPGDKMLSNSSKTNVELSNDYPKEVKLSIKRKHWYVVNSSPMKWSTSALKFKPQPETAGCYDIAMNKVNCSGTVGRGAHIHRVL
jgi:hypothetical protein